MISTRGTRAAAGAASAIWSGSILTMIWRVLLPSLTLVVSDLQARNMAPLQPGSPLDYSKFAFQPESWKKRGLSLKLIPWTGTNVVFLTTEATLDPALMGIWVSRLDAGWQVYADLTGRVPSPSRQFEGKVTIAAVPGYDLTCGAGCGFVGATGIELAMFYDHKKEGALSQCWFWLLCSSVAAQKDLSPVFAGEWKLPIAEETRVALRGIDWKKKGLALKEVTDTVAPVWRGSNTAQ
jgi:hypothetical protein